MRLPPFHTQKTLARKSQSLANLSLRIAICLTVALPTAWFASPSYLRHDKPSNNQNQVNAQPNKIAIYRSELDFWQHRNFVFLAHLRHCDV